MIDRKQLLADLKPLLREMETDLRARCDEVAQIDADLTKEYEQARAANRRGATFEEWRADLITQVAMAWVLSSVFVRFLEDNCLISPPRISGPLHGASDGQGLMRARDERDLFFRSHPTQTDRDYLLAIFDDLARLPGTKDVFGPHNPVSAYRDWLSGDAARSSSSSFRSSTPSAPARSSMTSRLTSGTPASWGTFTRTSPRPPARSTPCSTRRSLWKSSSSNARWNRPSWNSALKNSR